jgi:hypothetical protein
MKCNRCLTDKPDTDFPLGEKICRRCKNKAGRERRLKIKQIEDEAEMQMDLVLKQVKK